MEFWFHGIWLARLLVQRGMAALYLIAFLVVLRQFKPLLGEQGLLPVPRFAERVHFRDAPSLFLLGYSDRLLDFSGWLGVALSALALFGVTDAGPLWKTVG